MKARREQTVLREAEGVVLMVGSLLLSVSVVQVRSAVSPLCVCVCVCVCVSGSIFLNSKESARKTYTLPQCCNRLI